MGSPTPSSTLSPKEGKAGARQKSMGALLHVLRGRTWPQAVRSITKWREHTPTLYRRRLKDVCTSRSAHRGTGTVPGRHCQARRRDPARAPALLATCSGGEPDGWCGMRWHRTGCKSLAAHPAQPKRRRRAAQLRRSRPRTHYQHHRPSNSGSGGHSEGGATQRQRALPRYVHSCAARSRPLQTASAAAPPAPMSLGPQGDWSLVAGLGALVSGTWSLAS